MRDQTIIQQFGQMQQQLNQMESQLVSMSKVLREIVGKELLRSQAVQVALIKKGTLADSEIVAALQELIDGAKQDLKEEADKVEAEKLKAVEILVPNNMPLPVKETTDGTNGPL
jgi:hypothetical protein